MDLQTDTPTDQIEVNWTELIFNKQIYMDDTARKSRKIWEC